MVYVLLTLHKLLYLKQGCTSKNQLQSKISEAYKSPSFFSQFKAEILPKENKWKHTFQLKVIMAFFKTKWYSDAGVYRRTDVRSQVQLLNHNGYLEKREIIAGFIRARPSWKLILKTKHLVFNKITAKRTHFFSS